MTPSEPSAPHADIQAAFMAEEVSDKCKRGQPPRLCTPFPSPTPPPSHYARSNSPEILPKSHRPLPSLSPLSSLTPPPAHASREPTVFNAREYTPNTVSIQTHAELVRTWLESNPDEPWVIPPESVYKTLLEYFSHPPRQRKNLPLPADPALRFWMKRRSVHVRHTMSTARGRVFIPDGELYEKLCWAHGQMHRSAAYTSSMLNKHFYVAPEHSFVRYWCDSCPGCQ